MKLLPDLPADRRGLHIADSFLTEWLPKFEDLNSLKITIFLYWTWHNSELDFPVFDGEAFQKKLQAEGMKHEQIQNGLKILIADGILTKPEHSHKKWEAALVLNTPSGQAALESIRKGTLTQEPIGISPSIKTSSQETTIYKLYEENIGVITPIMADTLRDLETTYPPEWISEAFTIAVKKNVRNMRYIEAILERWQKEGKNDRTDRRDRKKTKGKPGTAGYTADQFPGLFEED